mgnify:CR=1 FL=1
MCGLSADNVGDTGLAGPIGAKAGPLLARRYKPVDATPVPYTPLTLPTNTEMLLYIYVG